MHLLRLVHFHVPGRWMTPLGPNHQSPIPKWKLLIIHRFLGVTSPEVNDLNKELMGYSSAHRVCLKLDFLVGIFIGSKETQGYTDTRDASSKMTTEGARLLNTIVVSRAFVPLPSSEQVHDRSPFQFWICLKFYMISGWGR